MDVAVHGTVSPAPFLRARDLFETTYDLELPVEVRLRDDPDQRTWAAHYDEHHVLNISRRAATSAMASELALHEYAHMHRFERRHPSHVQSTAEALLLALAGRRVERRKLVHCHQIANHMKDIYADDLTLTVAPADKLVAFLESALAESVADRAVAHPVGWTRLTPSADPEITAINAAFALALLERHDAIDPDHHLYELARIADRDAPQVDVGSFKRRFRGLRDDTDTSDYRKALVEATRRYALGGSA